MRRRHWLVVVALAAAGCSTPKKTTRKKTVKSTRSSRTRSSSGPTSSGRARMNSGPQGFGNVLVPAYIDDLKTGSADKKIAAARELGNMGASAREALPVLEELAGDKNPQVSAAAKSAAAAIRK